MRKRILSVGIADDDDSEADRYFVALEWFPGRKPLIQTCSRAEFDEVIRQLRAQDCEVRFVDPDAPTLGELSALAAIIAEKRPELDVELAVE